MKPYSPFDKKESVKAKANKREKVLAKKAGGRRHPCSGALAGFKGDFSTDDFLFDSKATQHESISVKLSDLVKIEREANTAAKHPALVLSFECMPGYDWAVVPMEVLIGEK